MAISRTEPIIQHLRTIALRAHGTGMTDGQLLENFVTNHDAAAFEALVRRHGLMVWGACRRLLRNQQDAEDAFQATFLVLARKAASVFPREMVGNWLYGVAHITALRAKSLAAKQRVRERQVKDMPEPATADTRRSKDLQTLLDEELSRLPDKYRIAIVLCDLESRTRREVAQQLKIPDGTLSSRLTTGRRLLAQRLARRGLSFSGGALATVLSQSAASACLPTSLVAITVNAATSVAAGRAVAAGVISSKVTALANGVLKAMLITKLKKVATVLVVLGVLAFGAALVTQQASTAQQGQVAPRQSVAGLTPKAINPLEAAPAQQTLRTEAVPDPPLYRFTTLVGEGEPAKASADKRDRAIRVEIIQPGAGPEPGEYVDVLATRRPVFLTKTVVSGLKVLFVAAPRANVIALTLQVSSAEADALAATQEDAMLTVTRHRFATLPKSQRALAIRAFAPDIVKPGATVDVLGVVRMADAAITVQQVAQKVKVLAIDAPRDQAQGGHIVTLAVSPAQAEALASAQQLGTLRLVAFLTEDSPNHGKSEEKN